MLKVNFDKFKSIYAHINIATNKINTESSHLFRLRRNTGFQIAKCRRALDMFYNDYEKAKLWLEETASKENWEKAQKLKNRHTAHGLIGTLVSRDSTHGYIIELNCETDFVTKNQKFTLLLEHIMLSINTSITNFGQFNASIMNHMNNDKKIISQINLDAHALKDCSFSGKTVKNFLETTIGVLGENINLRRASAVFLNPDYLNLQCNYKIGSYCHNTYNLTTNKHIHEDISGLNMGKYGALVAIKYNANDYMKDDDSMVIETKMLDISNQLAQHVVGMNPKCIGYNEKNISESGLTPEKPCIHNITMPDELLSVNQTEELNSIKSSEQEFYNDEEFSPQFYDEYYSNIKRQEAKASENRFIKQAFLADPDFTVEEILNENSMEILDFARFECGEQIDDN